MSFEQLSLEQKDDIAFLTIDRPKKLNALDEATMSEIDEAVSALESDSAVRAVIVTGAGDKAFVAGADIKELAEKNAASGYQTSLRGQGIFRRVETMTKPVIAAVNGFALGGGLELALACHLRVAAEGAKMGLPEVTLGAIPGYGGTQRLARLVGRGRALELILTGQPIGAAEAHRMGLVNRVATAESLLKATEELARQIIRNAPLALSHALVAVDRGLEAGQDEGMLMEATLFGILCSSEDLREGMRAFLEKRPAKFEGK
jgi:enoyl-CoA hydratase